jgi:acyl-CoA hydrolase
LRGLDVRRVFEARNSANRLLHPADATRMSDSQAHQGETLTHRLVLPRDANHHGTLYAGALLSLALEAAYACGFHAAGLNANLVLKRVLDLRCYEPVPVGRVVLIRGRLLIRARAHVVIGLWGSPLVDQNSPWMDGLMQFVQVDRGGHPEAMEDEPAVEAAELEAPWLNLQGRARRLLHIRQ